MNILVIGNGFDIAHGLPTKYGDFLNYVQAFDRMKNSTEDCDSLYYKYFQSLKNTRPEIYNELDKLITDNCWLDYFTKIYERRETEGKDGWIDFESEISLVIQALDSARHAINEALKHDDENEHFCLQQWHLDILCPVVFRDGIIKNHEVFTFTASNIIAIKTLFLNCLNKLIRCLEIYLSDYISIDTCSQLQDIANLEIHRVLSFNYTDTYKQIYDKSAGSIKYDFIHGKADIANDVNSCNLVLGIDEYLSGEAKDKDNEFIQFKKFFQRIYKGTGCLYTDWVSLINDNNKRFAKASPTINNVYIYGHSLDVTDADIFRRLILLDNTITTIFYHSKESMGSQIANLVKVIGEDELIKRTDGSNRSIIFKKSSSEKL